MAGGANHTSAVEWAPMHCSVPESMGVAWPGHPGHGLACYPEFRGSGWKLNPDSLPWAPWLSIGVRPSSVPQG